MDEDAVVGWFNTLYRTIGMVDLAINEVNLRSLLLRQESTKIDEIKFLS